MKVTFVRNDRGNPPGKLADAELRFDVGFLDGLKLIGFAIWERRGSSARTVTFPARQYSVNGERRSFALLRPFSDSASLDRLRDTILNAYTVFENSQAQSSDDGDWSTQRGSSTWARPSPPAECGRRPQTNYWP